jgi:hypothetical protein
MRCHMCGLHLWKFLTGELSWPPSPTALVRPRIPEKASDEDKAKLLADFDDLMAS